MKVFAALVLVIGSAAALGSGPYLPSGWRPDGPAFNLPSEPQKPVNILQESEGASSDFLREYGPPKGVEVQSLPEVTTEQSFTQEEDSTEVDEAVTEIIQVAKGRSLDLADENEAVAVVAEVSAVSDDSEAAVEVTAVEEGVNNIAEIQVAQDVTELRSGQLNSGSSGVPVGFLEYGPPGFREYGPPKQNSIERADKDTNQARRRRRFSPKFKVVRKQRSLHKRKHH